MMRSFSWDNYKFILAIHRCESISGAARFLGVNETTVSRRLVQTEKYLAAKLFSRRSTGLVATDAGLRVLERLYRVKAEIDQTTSSVAGKQSAVYGLVKLACDSMLLNHMLLPQLDELLSAHPHLSCQLTSLSHATSLRDADMALIIGPPGSVTSSIDSNTMHALGQIQRGVFAQRTLAENRSAKDIPWIEFSEVPSGKDHLKKALFMGDNIHSTRVSVDSNELLMSCALSGLGKAWLPIAIADGDRRLVSVDDECARENVELYCRFQPELAGSARLDVCVQWLKNCVTRFESDSGV